LLPCIWLIGVSPCDASVQPPPPIYDHPFEGEIIIVGIPTRERMLQLWEAFGGQANGQGGITFSFTRYRNNKSYCLIFTLYEKDLRLKGYSPEEILRHERAHCNGWPSDHPLR